MPDTYKILETNPTLQLIEGVYRYPTPTHRDSKLSHYLQTTLVRIFKQAKNLSMFSLEMEKACTTTELRQAIPPQKFNYVRLLNLQKDMRVLDLSADFGGIAHYLADQVSSVQSVQADIAQAEIARLRCRDKDNVVVVAEDIFELGFAEQYYDLIILGDVDSYASAPETLNTLLRKAKAALSDTGSLILNTLNSNRLSKTFDAQSADFDTTIPYIDLYNGGTEETVENALETDTSKRQGHNRKELKARLIRNGFKANNLHASFGQNNLCSNLFSEEYLASNSNALNHCYRMGSIDNPSVNEYLLYKATLRQHQQLVDLATRYTVICGNSSVLNRKLYNNDFTYFPGSGRQPQWRTITKRERGDGMVIKRPTHVDTVAESDLITQNLTPQPFFNGKVLVDDWLQALLDSDESKFETLIKEYADWLNEKQQKKGFTQTAYDMLPFNILVKEHDQQRQYQTIDPEWQINANFDANFVLFRALFWFAFENKTLIKSFADKFNLFSIGTFVLRFMPEHETVEELLPYVEFEERIQQQIDENFRINAVANAVTQAFNENADNTQTQPYLQLSWGNKENYFDESNALSIDWPAIDGLQTFETELPINLENFTVLRIDPIARKGTFRFNAFELIDHSGTSIWKADSAMAVNDLANVNNAVLSKELFIALNDDPHFLFDLDMIAKSYHDAATLRVTLEWVWDEGYSDALDTLNEIIARQNSALFSQKHNINQLNAENRYQSTRIDDLIEQRDAVDAMLRERIEQLDRRNQELHGMMLMRPSTRIKRVLGRTISNAVENIFGKKDGNDTHGLADALEQNITQDTDNNTEKTAVKEGSQKLDNNAIADSDEQVESSNQAVTVSADEAEQMVARDPNLIGQNEEDYDLWVEQNSLNEREIEQARADIEAMPVKPVFSILVPTYNTAPEYLIPMIRSVQNQIYPHWELCIVDDCSPKTYVRGLLEYEAQLDSRIKVQLNEVNQGIAITTNNALALASGDYIALLDHDDEISIDALYENAKVINHTPSVGLIYSDEDKMDIEGNRLEPFFKPDYSPDYLDTNNYICHFTVIKKDIADEIGGFREGVDGSQDHDIILRAIAESENVAHIPKILYHWRKIPGSTAVTYDSKSYAWEAGRKAVEDNLTKKEDGVHVEFGSMKGTYRVVREIKNNPLVSIIIPFKDKPELLDSCINSIIEKSTYQNFEIVGVSNNSEESLTFERMSHFKELDSRVRFVEKNIPFNFSAICNYGVEQASGDYVILLNNDIEIISNNWIECMLEHAQRPEVGAVGGKLLYPDGRIQHAGVVAGMVGAAGHPHKFFPDYHIGYHGRLHMVYNVSAVTGAMLVIATDKYKQVGGLDEDNLAVAYNDIDLCLRLLDAGYYNVFTPHSVATHHESISRGYEDTDEKLNRFKKEQLFFLNKWADFLKKGDPYYNPNLSLESESFSLNFKGN